MKKLLLVATITLTLPLSMVTAHATTDLLQVYQQALKNDPTYQKALATEMADREKLPQSISSILPQINLSGSGTLSKTQTSTTIASALTSDGTSKSRGLNYKLELQQSIFNFSHWTDIASAHNSVKAAEATFNAAEQNLMSRVASAYFAVLNAKDVLKFTTAEKRAFYREYQRAHESYKVGLKTITDVYNAKAAYDGSVAQFVAAKNDLSNKREDLRAITGTYYTDLAPLKGSFKLHNPLPNDITTWAHRAAIQSWEIKAAHFDALAAHDAIASAAGGHLPSVKLTADYGNNYSRTFGSGRTRAKGPSGEIDVTLPIFSGGNVSSKTREAIAQYEEAHSTLIATQRSVLNTTRKDFLGVLSGISQVNADYQSVISNRSSLNSTKEGYKVGTRTMIDVLDAQKQLLQAQKIYASDRYTYIIDSLGLKKATGILSQADLEALNLELTSPKRTNNV